MDKLKQMFMTKVLSSNTADKGVERSKLLSSGPKSQASNPRSQDPKPQGSNSKPQGTKLLSASFPIFPAKINESERTAFLVPTNSSAQDHYLATPCLPPKELKTIPSSWSDDDEGLEPSDEVLEEPVVNTLWTEKYRPSLFSDVIGNNKAKSDSLDWLNKKIAKVPGVEPFLLISGSAGIGKTTLAHALLKSKGYKVTECNASDVRSPDKLIATIKQVTERRTIESLCERAPVHDPRLPGLGKNALVIDEVDGIFLAENCGDDDGPKTGNLSNIVRFLTCGDNRYGKITPSATPIIMICNSERTIKELSYASLSVKMWPLTDREMNMISTDILKREGIHVDASQLSAARAAAKGDVRSLINNLQVSKPKKQEIESLKKKSEESSVLSAAQSAGRMAPEAAQGAGRTTLEIAQSAGRSAQSIINHGEYPFRRRTDLLDASSSSKSVTMTVFDAAHRALYSTSPTERVKTEAIFTQELSYADPLSFHNYPKTFKTQNSSTPVKDRPKGPPTAAERAELDDMDALAAMADRFSECDVMNTFVGSAGHQALDEDGAAAGPRGMEGVAGPILMRALDPRLDPKTHSRRKTFDFSRQGFEYQPPHMTPTTFFDERNKAIDAIAEARSLEYLVPSLARGLSAMEISELKEVSRSKHKSASAQGYSEYQKNLKQALRQEIEATRRDDFDTIEDAEHGTERYLTTVMNVLAPTTFTILGKSKKIPLGTKKRPFPFKSKGNFYKKKY